MSSNRPRRRLLPAERRAEILEAATAIVAARGYSDFTLSELAQRSGITRAGLSHHFESREAVLVALLAERDEIDLARDLPSTAEEFAEALRQVVERNLQEPEIARMYSLLSSGAIAPEHPAHEFFAARLTSVRQALARAAAQWHDDPEGLALEVHSFLDGLLTCWLMDPQIDMRAAYEKFAVRFRTQERV